MSENTCSADDCTRPVAVKGFCKPHYDQDYYQRTRERQRAKRREWYEANGEAVKAKQRAAYAADPGKYQARVRAFKAAHPGYYDEYWAAYLLRS